MSEPRGPVRHGNRARRPLRPPAVRATPAPPVADPPPSADLQAVFTALARRAKLPTGPETRPSDVLRSAGLPLLMAAVVAGGQSAPAGADGGEPPAGAGAASSGMSGWTVTTLQPPGTPAAATTPPTTGSANLTAPTTAAPTTAAASTPATAKASAARVTPARPATTATVATRATTAVKTPAVKAPAVKAPAVKVPVVKAPAVKAPAAHRPAPRKTVPPPTKAPTAAKTPNAANAPTAPNAPTSPNAPSAPSAPKVPTTAKASAAAPDAAPAPVARRSYVVEPGDTLIGIGREQRVAVTDILRLNRLRLDSVIHPGDRLLLPAPVGGPRPGETAAALPATRTYVVRPGDSLIGISQQQRAKLHDILELNHLHLESVIHPGDRLLLPPLPVDGAPSSGQERVYPAAVVAAANANRAALARASVPTRQQARSMVAATARSVGVDPALALGIAYLESGFSQRMVSPANAVGVMQVVPSAGRWASELIGRALDVMNAQDNITAGVALLRTLLKVAGTEAQAIAGYYQGLSSVQRHGMFDDTRRYVANVQTLRTRFAAGG
jgi:N-acetylmuramoyl-L-alanine amidase